MWRMCLHVCAKHLVYTGLVTLACVPEEIQYIPVDTQGYLLLALRRH